MTIRRLAPDEYGVLTDIADGFMPNPNNSIVIAAFDNDKLVGRTCFLQMGHIEGTWVDKQHRNGFIGFRMLKALEKEAYGHGFTTSLAYAADEQVEKYLERLGYMKQPLSIWAKELK
jgi:GNAT superfamily N-acetyltransferase